MKALKVKRTDKKRENNLEESLSESDALIENLLIWGSNRRPPHYEYDSVCAAIENASKNIIQHYNGLL